VPIAFLNKFFVIGSLFLLDQPIIILINAFLPISQ